MQKKRNPENRPKKKKKKKSNAVFISAKIKAWHLHLNLSSVIAFRGGQLQVTHALLLSDRVLTLFLIKYKQKKNSFFFFSNEKAKVSNSFSGELEPVVEQNYVSCKSSPAVLQLCFSLGIKGNILSTTQD